MQDHQSSLLVLNYSQCLCLDKNILNTCLNNLEQFLIHILLHNRFQSVVIWSNKLLTISGVCGGNVLPEQQDANTVAWSGKKTFSCFLGSKIGKWTGDLVKVLKTKFSVGICLLLYVELSQVYGQKWHFPIFFSLPTEKILPVTCTLYHRWTVISMCQ